MSLDKANVSHIAKLARIKLADDRQDVLADELNSILGWVEQLSAVDTGDTPPLANVTGHDLPEREDVVNDGDIAARVLANAPDPIDAFFAVPKVIE